MEDNYVIDGFENEENSSEQSENQFSSSNNLTYEDIYNAVYNGYLDAYSETKIQEAENAKLSEEEVEENEEEVEKKEEEKEKENKEIVYKVNVQNFPDLQSVEVDNSEELRSTNDSNDNNVVEFASGTDARLYTVRAVSEVSSADEQTALYMLDTRNILLIFLLIWFVLYIIKMVRNVFIKYTKGKGASV